MKYILILQNNSILNNNMFRTKVKIDTYVIYGYNIVSLKGEKI